MHAKLTQSLVESTQPAPRDLSILDSSLRGFELRIRPTGAKVWAYRHRLPDGRQRRLVLGHFPGIGAVAARRLALEAAGEVAKGVDVVTRKRATREEGARIRQSTLGAFLDAQYELWAGANLKTSAFQIERIRADFKEWLDRPMADLDSWLIEGWRKRRLEAGNKPSTVNRNLQRLQALLSKAVEWKVVERHPFEGLRPLKSDRSGRVRYLDEAEERRFREALGERDFRLRQARERFNKWRAARGRSPLPLRTDKYVDHLHPLALVALNTGLRRSELFHLKWEDVDLTAKWLTVKGATAKSGQTRRIPLNAEALDVLQGWHTQTADPGVHTLVFPGAHGRRLTRIDTAWKGLRKLGEVLNFRFHDLRHHFASRLVQSGVDLNTVRELLGHADITMVLRYAHLSPDRLALAVERVARGGDVTSPTSSLSKSQIGTIVSS
jgi:integrase